MVDSHKTRPQACRANLPEANRLRGAEERTLLTHFDVDFHNDDDLIGLGKAFSSLAEATVKAFDTIPGLVLTPASGDPFGSVEFDDNVLGTMDKEGSTLQDASFNFSMTDSAEITLEGTFNGDTIDSFGTVSLDLTVEQGAANYHNGQWMYGNLASLSGSISAGGSFPGIGDLYSFLAGRRTHCIQRRADRPFVGQGHGHDYCQWHSHGENFGKFYGPNGEYKNHPPRKHTRGSLQFQCCSPGQRSRRGVRGERGCDRGGASSGVFQNRRSDRPSRHGNPIGSHDSAPQPDLGRRSLRPGRLGRGRLGECGHVL